LWLIDWVAWLSLIHEFHCRRREKEGEEMIEGLILDLVNDFIIIDYEITSRSKKKKEQGGHGFVVD
jgi:protein-tyrosine phosphatase